MPMKNRPKIHHLRMKQDYPDETVMNTIKILAVVAMIVTLCVVMVKVFN